MHISFEIHIVEMYIKAFHKFIDFLLSINDQFSNHTQTRAQSQAHIFYTIQLCRIWEYTLAGDHDAMMCTRVKKIYNHNSESNEKFRSVWA